MAEMRVGKVEQGQTKIRSVPIAVTPEGFWCCPSPVAFQKTLKAHNSLHRPKSSSVSSPPPPQKATAHRKQTILNEKKPSFGQSRSVSDGQMDVGPDAPDSPAHGAAMNAERVPRPKVENLPRKVAIEFGEPGTSDMKVILLGKQGFCVKLSVHKNVLVENSSFFAARLAEQHGSSSCLEIEECEDVEIYVETVGLMYCKEMRQRLMKQSVSRVLRILKIAEVLGFSSCMQSCLEYLEAAPWVGDEEEKVVSSVLRLQNEGIGVSPILKRLSSNVCEAPKDTLSHVIALVLGSNEERGRREMKSVVIKLLRENNSVASSSNPSDVWNHTLYDSCRNCSSLLLSLFKQAAEPESTEKPTDNKDPLVKKIALASDNLTWLLDILADRQAADEFAVLWAGQQELAALHMKLPIVSRYHVSIITARLFVGIGKGELLPSKDTRQLLLQTWLQPLISDYNWLQHGCRSFDRKAVEEGIGRTILTLPLEDQQSIMLSWLGSFLKSGDSCPNLQKAFEVWWRRTFVRPYVDGQQGNSVESHSSMTS